MYLEKVHYPNVTPLLHEKFIKEIIQSQPGYLEFHESLHRIRTFKIFYVAYYKYVIAETPDKMLQRLKKARRRFTYLLKCMQICRL